MKDGKETGSHRPSGAGTLAELSARFEYDRNAPFDLEEQEATDRGTISVQDLTYAGLDGGRIPAYWIAPTDRDRFAAVLFVHPAPGNRSSFFNEALRLGGMGIASLLIEAPWAAGEAWARTLGTPEQNREIFAAIVRELRRALDLVLARTGVDPGRVAYVGHSFGALCGGVLAGVDHRCRACVLMAGAPSFTDVAVANLPSLAGEALEHYREVMAPIDPATFIGHAAPAKLLLQFGERDQIFSREQSQAFADAASDPKLVRWYDTDHAFESEEAKRDRVEWLHAQLGTGYRRMKGKTGRPPARRR